MASYTNYLVGYKAIQESVNKTKLFWIKTTWGKDCKWTVLQFSYTHRGLDLHVDSNFFNVMREMHTTRFVYNMGILEKQVMKKNSECSDDKSVWFNLNERLNKVLVYQKGQ